MAADAEPKAATLARAARDQGLAAAAEGDRRSAIRWLERAHRLVPSDLRIAQTLATACLGSDNSRAAGLFQEILTSGDLREAWWGLAGARMLMGDPASAADAVGAALRRHAPPPGTEPIANAVVRALGLPGWCGLLGTGRPLVRPNATSDLEVNIDGRTVSLSDARVDWTQARSLMIGAHGIPLLGSPIDVTAIGRTVGYVDVAGGGLRGWAAHPGDPETKPELKVLDVSGHVVRRIICKAAEVAVPGNNGWLRPREFRVSAAQLDGAAGPFRIVGRDSADLLGGPLTPGLLDRIATRRGARSVSPLSAAYAAAPRPVAVVVPAVGEAASTIACLESVLASDLGDSLLLVVDDTLPEGALAEAFGHLIQVEVLRHDRRLGWAAGVNSGIAACADRDVVLLNNDAVVPPGWLKRLITAAYSKPDIGTVTPFSNDAAFVSYPMPRTTGAGWDRAQTIQLDRLAQRANATVSTEIPVGVAGCLFVKRACLDGVGIFNADIFVGGHGAETDFCLRARVLGWRHVALPGLFVGRGGQVDRGPPIDQLMMRNEAIVSRLHPTHKASMRAFLALDPLAFARKRLDEARWHAAATSGQRSVILITHAHGGGVEQRVASAAAGYRLGGLRPIILRPSKMADGRHGVIVGDAPDGGFPNLRFGLPDEMPALLRFLRRENPAWIEVHHLLGHGPTIYDAVRRLGIPYDVHIHDYAWICPRISLVGAENRYCGEPDLAGCNACLVSNGSLTGEAIGVGALRRRSAAFLAKARRAIAPSADTAMRMRRYFPALPIVVVPHSHDTGFPPLAGSSGTVRICVLGGIGPHKGFDVLLACARDAADRTLGIEFLVVGDTTDDATLLDTGRAHITGTYEPGEAVGLVRAQNATMGFVPSVWPETWSLTLTELWQAGLRVAAFDIGAPAERIRATGRGILLPLGLSPAAINDALLAAARRFGHE